MEISLNISVPYNRCDHKRNVYCHYIDICEIILRSDTYDHYETTLGDAKDHYETILGGETRVHYETVLGGETLGHYEIVLEVRHRTIIILY